MNTKYNKMKSLSIFTMTLFIASLTLVSCGGGGEKSTEGDAPPPQSMVAEETVDPMENPGVGPVKSVDIPDEIDAELAAAGKEVYDRLCTSCHKPDVKYIGPAPKGILDRRSPEWVMNMIINPEEMVANDPIAKQLLIDYNGSPMANQNVSEDEARAILEYFRTL